MPAIPNSSILSCAVVETPDAILMRQVVELIEKQQELAWRREVVCHEEEVTVSAKVQPTTGQEPVVTLQ